MQARFTGRQFSFGDLSIACAHVSRRTSDTQHIGQAIAITHAGTVLRDQAGPALAELTEMLFEEIKESTSSWTAPITRAAFKQVVLPRTMADVNVLKPESEALLYIAAATML